MIYVYEAVSLVLASVILGTAIGILIGASLTLQFNLFTELPFNMRFPTGLFLTMFFMAFAVSILGSALPAYGLLKKSISSVLRRQ
jgi:ABC-type antimicrobial peptide transport system permease subunit